MSQRPHTALAHAKLNISLRVLAREADGFHQIETIFCGIELADEVHVMESPGGVALDVTAPPDLPGHVPDLGPVESNLAFRAATLFAAAAGIEPAWHIRLVKRIPAGAGLGGGSSDAAAVLRVLNEMHGAVLPQSRLLELGAGLGSDVPFFVAGVPLALAWGRGGRLAPLQPLPSAPVLLAVPPERVATADAYAALAAARARSTTAHEASRAALVDVRPRAWSDLAVVAHNDFEATVFQQLPRLAVLRDTMEAAGAHIARLTGSGSVVFGIYDSDQQAARVQREMAGQFADVRSILTRTRETL